MSDQLALLEKIVENTSNSSNSLWVAAITGGTAALVTLIAAYFTHKSTEKSVELEKHKLKSEQRNRFLESLKANVAEFYTDVEMYYGHLKKEVNGSVQEYQHKADEYQQKILQRGHTIQVLLDTKNPAQRSLYDGIGAAQSFLVNCALQSTKERQEFDDVMYVNIKSSVFTLLNDVCSNYDEN
ncbi:hypothetical protein ACOIXT_003785 [Vibrio parahaemolyticus]